MLDAQKFKNVEQLVLELNQGLHARNLLPGEWHDRVKDWFQRTIQRLQGKKIHTSEVPHVEGWSSFLEGTCRKFVETQGEKLAVIVIDEFPFLLDELIKAGRSTDATQLLDTLRALRQELPTLRMVLCGSLGLHIVLDKLKESKYTGQPVNDMPPFEVTPLDKDAALFLAGGLLLGEGVQCSDIAKTAAALAETCSNVPFYIQHAADWMATNASGEWTPAKARNVPKAMFDAANDPAEFRYYDDRLDLYYDEDIVAKARAMLKILSRHADGLGFNELLNLLRHEARCVESDEHEARRVLSTLRDDHYLVSEGAKWAFKLDIVRQWWHHTRGA